METKRIFNGKRDYLYLVLFLVIFINGFESGGYQASLWSIGNTYDLSKTSMGIFASVELTATMLAPILLGSWADHTGKKKSIEIMLILQAFATVWIFLSKSQTSFLLAVFIVGLTTSALQFISIAMLADEYPVSHSSKIGYMTSMYALGAFTAPLIVHWYMEIGFSWRTLFLLLTLTSIVAAIGMFTTMEGIRESRSNTTGEEIEGNGGEFVLLGVVLLAVIMCIYVGFENGFSFFIDSYLKDDLGDSKGKLALSVFWAVMIPARILVGHFSEHTKKILLGSVIAIPLLTTVIASATDGISIILLCIPLGMASGAIYPSVLTILMNFSGKRTAMATGLITAATGLGANVFTAMTGFLVDIFGFRNALAILASFFMISIISVLQVKQLLIRLGKRKD